VCLLYVAGCFPDADCAQQRVIIQVIYPLYPAYCCTSARLRAALYSLVLQLTTLYFTLALYHVYAYIVV